MEKINIYSNKSINFISVILSILIFLLINIPTIKFKNNSIENPNKEIIQKNIIENENKIEEENNEDEWYIEIPSINLKAPIQESTNMEILNKYIGHFEETPLKEGNVGLAGHNRGYEKNYFENLKKLKIGEEIKYKYKQLKKTYIINIIEKIKETNWRYLENTKENRITLITCIENQPKYRLCVQAVEKTE